jgi:L,D-transpeptidase YcbB
MFSDNNITGIALKKILLLFFIMSCFVTKSIAQQPSSKEDSIRIQKFYVAFHEPLFWFSSGKNIKRANEWIKLIVSDKQSGFVSNKVEIDQIRYVLSNKKQIDNILKEKTDKQITGLVLNYIRFLKEGNVKFDYDEVNISRDSVYALQLITTGHKISAAGIVSKVDCKDQDYLVLKKYLHDSIPDKNSLKYKTVLLAMNYRKYITINQRPEFILINIPATEAEYYKDGLLTLKMRTVVGKKLKPTPTISSYITSIVTFPSWNVPHEIAVKEMLPKVQKNDNYLEQNNFEVVDAKGNEVDDSELNWKAYTEKNFPYFFRQSSGSDNSMGVLKFNLQNPFSIFLHSTSMQSSFAKDYRFLSHGCIRMEKPFELAADLLRGRINLEELRSGKKDSESKTIKLTNKIPVFIIYMPIKVVGKKVIFLKDVYGSIN